jgi:hypothetical protein
LVQPFTWQFGVPDGEERSYGGPCQDGCHNIPSYRRRDDEGDSSGQRNTWRDMTAAPARARAPAANVAGRGGRGGHATASALRQVIESAPPASLHPLPRSSTSCYHHHHRCPRQALPHSA